MDVWNQIESWELVLPPSRPSQRHLDWFQQHLGELRVDDTIAILGSTPELRDLLARLGFRDIFLLERNAKFLKQMNRIRVRVNPETVLAGDWLQTLPNCAEKFSAVLSDLTSGNVPYSRRSEFYFLISESLRPGRTFCDKLLSYPIAHERLDKLNSKYEMAPLNLETVNRFNCEMFFCSELLTKFGRVDTTRLYEYLDWLNLGATLRAILDRLPRVTPPGMAWDYGESWEVVQKELDSRLRCSDDYLEVEDSPYANRLRCLRWDKPKCSK